MTLWYQDGSTSLYLGDCLSVMAGMADCSVDAIVCDPPYALTAGKKGGSGPASLNLASPAGRSRITTGGGFMGQAWDAHIPGPEYWAEALRVAKPGAHLLALGGTRTWHRLACAIEDAGWELRDCLMWLFAQGFPKGLNVVTESWENACKWLSNASVPHVVQCSTPIRVRLSEEREPTVLAPARILPEGVPVLLMETGRVGGSKEVTAMSLSETLKSRVNTALSTMWWSSASSDDGYKGGSTFTTITEPETITDPVILSLLIGLTTRGTITTAPETLLDGSLWPAVTVLPSSSDGSTKPRVILTVTALGDATWNPVVRSRGMNSALKPSYEPVLLARKPLDGNVAQNVLKWGTGGLNIDGTRINYRDARDRSGATPQGRATSKLSGAVGAEPDAGRNLGRSTFERPELRGRWPANLLLDEEAAALLDQETGSRTSGRAAAGGHRRNQPPGEGVYGSGRGLWAAAGEAGTLYGDSGGVTVAFTAKDEALGTSTFSRGVYVAKASRSERERGLSGVPSRRTDGRSSEHEHPGLRTSPRLNTHPTVKPIALMRWLVRLVTPPGGSVVLDPFCGSGSTLIAARLEGFRAIGIDMEEPYLEIAAARINAWGED